MELFTFTAGLALGYILHGVLHAYYRYPRRDNSPKSQRDIDRDIFAASEEEGTHHWQTIVFEDVRGVESGTKFDG